MAVINANLRVITATVKVGADEYTTHIQDFKYTRSPNIASVTDVSGKVVKIAGQSGTDLVLNVFQDFTTTGLARKMHNDEGTSAVIVIVDGPTTWTSTVTLVAPDIGGSPNTIGVSTVTLPSTKPVPTATV